MDDKITTTPVGVYTFTAEHEGQRLDLFACQQFPDYSRSFFKTLIENGAVLVNQKVPHKAGFKLKKSDTITITFAPIKSERVYDKKQLQELGIEIVHRHPEFLVIYKPAGILVHPPTVKSDVLCVTDWLVGEFKEIQQVGYVDRPGIVHRLDKDTSGLLLIALSNPAHTKLSQLFKNRTIQKTYLAVVKGHPEKTGTIDLALGRHAVVRNKIAPVKNGRASLTHYTVLEYFEDCSLVEVKPVTGRTHQIRVHFSAIGHPLIGDTTYGTSSKLINRHALHAQKLAFEYDGKPFSFEKKIPTDFEKLICNLSLN